MLNVKPGNLLLEIHQAEEFRHEHLKNLPNSIDSYAGRYYRGKNAGDESTPENHYHEWLSLVVPKLTYDNPKVLVRTKRSGSQQEVATAIEQGLNRWVKDVDLRNTLARGPAVDMQFAWGVVICKHGEVPRAKETEGVGGPGERGKPYAPTIERLSQHWYFEDPIALSRDQIRFQGHMWVRDLDDLKAEAKDNPSLEWNEDMLEGLGTDGAGLDELNRPEGVDVRRGEIVGYDVWVPEYELEDSPGSEEGFHGTIFTLAYSNHEQGGVGGKAIDKNDEYSILEQEYLRPPRPYYGPPWGPYTVFGAYTVPDDPTPLSPLTVCEGLIRDLNRHAQATSRSAADYKRMVLVDAKDPKLVQTVKSAKHDYVIPANGIEPGAVWNLEVGGITDQQLGYLSVARDRLNRNSGIDEAKRGAPRDDVTATASAIADEAAETRMGFLEAQFTNGVKHALRTVAWFLYHDNRVAFPVGAEAAKAAGMQGRVEMVEGQPQVVPPELWYFGGRLDSDADYSFEDLELEIEPFSMSRINQSTYQARTIQTTQLVIQMAPLMVQFPFIRWQQVLDDLGNAMNMPDMGDLVDVEMAMAMAQAMMQGQGQIASQGGKATAPNLVSGDLTRKFVPTSFSGPVRQEQRREQTSSNGSANGGGSSAKSARA